MGSVFGIEAAEEVAFGLCVSIRMRLGGEMAYRALSKGSVDILVGWFVEL